MKFVKIRTKSFNRIMIVRVGYNSLHILLVGLLLQAIFPTREYVKVSTLKNYM